MPDASPTSGILPSKRQQLIDTAIRQFSVRGFHVGIDTILAEAGVAKMTLYKHFPSKEHLIAATLEVADERQIATVLDAVRAHAPDPCDRLLAFFDHFGAWFATEGFTGCLFQRAADAFPDPASPVHQAATRHADRLLQTMESLAAEAGAPSPGPLAAQLLLLLQGAIVQARCSHRPDVAVTARAAAAILIERAFDEPDG